MIYEIDLKEKTLTIEDLSEHNNEFQKERTTLIKYYKAKGYTIHRLFTNGIEGSKDLSFAGTPIGTTGTSSSGMTINVPASSGSIVYDGDGTTVTFSDIKELNDINKYTP